MRITPHIAREAYKKTGLKPAPGKWLEGDCACVVGAIVAAYHHADISHDFLYRTEFSRITGESVGYACGLEAGFDGEPSPLDADMQRGHADGVKCRKALLGDVK